MKKYDKERKDYVEMKSDISTHVLSLIMLY